MNVNIDRLRADLQALASIGRGASGGITRTSFSAADQQARTWYQARCAEASLPLEVDAIGNMLAGIPYAPGTPAVWSGSHFDTVPDGGAFDGALGAVAALECVRRLAEEAIELVRPVHAVVFSDEEGNYQHLLGSSALTRGFSREELEAMVGRDGDRLVDTMATGGWDVRALTGTKVDPGMVYAFVELHIEQGLRLEASATDIGVVSSIVGLGGGVAEFRGRADHAGATPMNHRRDPLRAGAELICALSEIARSVSEAAVATCGRVDVYPGSANVVPSLVRLSLDFRDADPAEFGTLRERIVERARSVALAHNVTLAWHPKQEIAPRSLHLGVRSAIEASAHRRNLSTVSMPSGACHDSQNMATITPTGMIFIPSKDGRSHSPAENTDWNHIENGANVLLSTLIELATVGIA